MRSISYSVAILLTLGTLCLSASPAPAAPRKEKDGDKFQPEPGTTVIDIGGQAEAVRTGGAGRYLIFRFKDAEHLTVVDAAAGKVLKQVPAPGEFLYAANRDKLLIVLNGQHVIQRWDLKTLEREKTALLDTDEVVKAVAMGDAGTGPLAVWSGGKVRFFDVDTLKPLTVSGDVVRQPSGVSLWPSADGLTFAAFGWTTDRIPVMRLSGVTATTAVCVTKPSNAWTGYNQAWALPGPDGSFLIGNNGGAAMFGADGQTQLDTKQFEGAVLYPTEDPRFVLSLRRQEGKPNTAAVVAAVDRRVLYTIILKETVTGGQIGTEIGRLGPEPRVRLLTKEKVLVTIPEGNDKVIVRPFDLEAALKATGADYLFVVSKPPAGLRLGQVLSYQVEALSRAGGLKYKVEDGPPGLAVSATGLVTWKAAGAGEGGRAGVVLAVSDAGGQEVNHAFDLQLVRDTAGPGQPVAAGAGGVIELWPESAVIRGERLTVDKDGSLGGWDRREEYVEWVVAPAAAGWYEVEVTQGCQGGGGEYEVVAGEEKVAGKVRGTKGWNDYEAVKVGAIKLPAGRVTVAVKPTRMRGALMNLKVVRLTPTTAPPAGWPGAGPGGTAASPADGGHPAGRPPAAAGPAGAKSIDLPPSDKLVIANALYGAGDQWADVTDKVRAAVRGDRVDIRVDNGPLGADPATEKAKELVVTYRDPAGGHIARFAEGHQAVITPGPKDGAGGAGKAAGPGGAAPAPATVARLVGTWEATPALDDAKVRALLKQKNVAPDQMAAAVVKFRQSMAGLKVTYTFNADGSAAGTFGTPADPHATKGKWEVVRETSKGAVVRYSPEGEPADELDVAFDGNDRFATPPPTAEFPVVSPVHFRRAAGPPPAAPAKPAGAGARAPAAGPAGAAPARPPAAAVGPAKPAAGAPAKPAPAAPAAPAPAAPAPAGGDPELAPLAKKMSDTLYASLEKDLGQDPGPTVTVSVDVGVEKAVRTADGAAITLGLVEIKQAEGATDTFDVHSSIVITLRKEAGKWAVVKADKLVDVVDPENRRTVDATHAMRRLADVAQGVNVPAAQPLGAGDKPLPGPAGDELTKLADRLAKDIEAAAQRAGRKRPTFAGATVRVAAVERTQDGATSLCSSAASPSRTARTAAPPSRPRPIPRRTSPSAERPAAGGRAPPRPTGWCP